MDWRAPIIVFVYICHFGVVLSHPQLSSHGSSANQLWNELHKAIEAGNEIEIKRLLSNGADINAINAKDETTGNTALLLAASKGHQNIVRILVENGANINDVDNLNNTALIVALDKGFDKVAKQLIRNGANVNESNVNGSTALILAAERGFEKTVQRLIQKGVDVNAANDKNDTALILAASKARTKYSYGRIQFYDTGHESVVKQLLGNGIDYDTDNILELLIIGQGKVNVNAMNKNNDTALILAASNGFEKVVQMLLDAGADVGSANAENTTALLYAAEKGYERIVRILMRESAVANANGDPVLIVAIMNDMEKALEVLIKNGADVNAANKYGTTPLMAAAKKGNKKMVELLLASNAINVNAVDSDGHTALDAVPTASEAREHLVRLLEQHGAEYKGAEFYRRVSQNACQLYSRLTNRWRYGTETRVFDGSLAESGEFPWMVALGYLNKQYKLSFQCGGSIISDAFVLTAAHCVKDIQRPVVARFGKITLSDEDDFRAENQNIQQIIPHPEYSVLTKKNDIALIRLIDRLTFTEFIQPICLQTELRDEDPHLNLIVSGWGRTNLGQASNELLKIDLKTMPLFECNANLLDYNTKRKLASFRDGIDRSQYCAHDPAGKKDSCQGDSGGPLQITRSFSRPAKVVGVVSFGIGCGRGRPGIYTRVAHFIEWIGSQVWPNGTIDTPQININSV